MHSLTHEYEYLGDPPPLGDLSSRALAIIILHNWRTGQEHPELLSRGGTLQDVRHELLRREYFGVGVRL